MTQARSRAFQRFAVPLSWLTLAWNVLVILWGAVVRATQSGAGCGNDWPLCNGQVFPISPRIHTVIEFIHRMTTTGAVILVLALLIAVFLATRDRAPRLWAGLSTLLLINEAFLGFLLVHLGYVTTNRSFGRVVVLSIHLTNTLLLLAALTITAALLTYRIQSKSTTSTRLFPMLAGIFATLLVGVTGSLAALGDTLFPAASFSQALLQDFASSSPWLLRLRWVHPAMACIAAVFVGWLVVRSWKTSFRLAQSALALILLQFVLGLMDAWLLAPVWLQVLHLFAADLLWITLILLCFFLLRPRNSIELAALSD